MGYNKALVNRAHVFTVHWVDIQKLCVFVAHSWYSRIPKHLGYYLYANTVSTRPHLGIEWPTQKNMEIFVERSDTFTGILPGSFQMKVNYSSVFRRRPSLDINIIRTRRSFSSHFRRCVCYTNMRTCTDANQIKHWPLSNGSTVNMHSGTLILSSKQSPPVGKAHMYGYISVAPRLRADNWSGDKNQYLYNSRIITSPK